MKEEEKRERRKKLSWVLLAYEGRKEKRLLLHITFWTDHKSRKFWLPPYIRRFTNVCKVEQVSVVDVPCQCGSTCPSQRSQSGYPQSKHNACFPSCTIRPSINYDVTIAHCGGHSDSIESKRNRDQRVEDWYEKKKKPEKSSIENKQRSNDTKMKWKQ